MLKEANWSSSHTSHQGKIFLVFILNPQTLMSRRSFTAKVCSQLILFLYDLMKYMDQVSSLVIFFSAGVGCYMLERVINLLSRN